MCRYRVWSDTNYTVEEENENNSKINKKKKFVHEQGETFLQERVSLSRFFPSTTSVRRRRRRWQWEQQKVLKAMLITHKQFCSCCVHKWRKMYIDAGWDGYLRCRAYVRRRSTVYTADHYQPAADMYMCLFVKPVISNFSTPRVITS